MPAAKSKPKPKSISIVIPHEHAGQRLDQVLAALLPDYSRTRLKSWIEAGHALVDGKQWRPRDTVLGDETVTVTPVLEADERRVSKVRIARITTTKEGTDT